MQVTTGAFDARTGEYLVKVTTEEYMMKEITVAAIDGHNRGASGIIHNRCIY